MAVISEKIYAEVILPLLSGGYTYLVPSGLAADVMPGCCVTVPLGKSKVYTGVVRSVGTDPPPSGNLREIIAVQGDVPPVNETRLKLWEWVADYYMCSVGEVMRAALPSAFKPSGWSGEEVTGKEYRTPTETHLTLGLAARDEEALNEAFENLSKRARSQYEGLLLLVRLLGEDDPFGRSVPRRLADIPYGVLHQLQSKGYVARREVKAGPAAVASEFAGLPQLSPAQETALHGIREHFRERDVVLLHGVTGSGKTEIYIRLIAEQLSAGKDVLYLLPEIAMTAQLVARIRKFFGDRVVPYHSSYTRTRKTAAYMRAAASPGGTLIVGVRSSVFLPGGNVGLVIVDEEHDPSYKNHESAPRYNARDTAVVLAGMAGAKTLLGSATPALETYVNAQTGKYGYVTLTERYGGAVMPRVVVSDTIMASKRGERKSHFNKLLLDSMAQALHDGRQVMLFQNRRGFSPYVECGECGWTASCPNCNVTLTYHKSGRNLRCHYCGHSTALPARCPACNLPSVEPRGFGTEKIEVELEPFFPQARIERLDRDTATSATRFERIISDFERGVTDILVGTQMITKGFDFEGVSVVGVLNADNLLAYPDFRASERAFQLLTQVAGRAGRRQTEGLVVIQTSQPRHPVIAQAAAGDYAAMARGQLAERREFFYPPYCRIVGIRLRHRDAQVVRQAAATLAQRLRMIFGKRVCGPQPPPVDRIRGEFIENILLKVERDSPFSKAKKLLAAEITALRSGEGFRQVVVTCDVDPI
ncbi:MAG: primosomal protein N' [Rikenellaceae bacterium]|nr:primosomal protein N' [Rikenellaceae bacterium]